MKCISLWQPWAALMAIGAKKIETRSWATAHRGRLAIHAAKTWNRQVRDMRHSETVCDELIRACNDGRLSSGDQPLPFGAIVAVVDLWFCEPTESMAHVTGNERAFGDYSPGRFAWITDPRKLIRLPKPIPFRGAQGIFNVPDELVAQQMLEAA